MAGYQRAVSSAALAAVCCFAVLAVVQYTGDSMSIKLSGVHHDPPPPEVDMLKNIIDLKAYCLAAYDNSNILLQNHKNLASIADFVHTFGINGGGDDVGGRKAEVDNIVTEYAHILGALKSKYGHGINMYILEHLDQSVRHEVGGPVFLQMSMQALGGGGSNGRKFGHLAGIKFESLGLEDQPMIIVELAAKYSKFLTFKAHVEAKAKNADVVAATLFLQSKSFGHYEGFLQREIAKVEKRMRSEFNFVAKAAFDAEEDAFQKSYETNREAFFEHAAKQAPAAVAASDEAAQEFPWKPPSMDVLKERAHNASVAFMHEFQEAHADPSSLLKRITDESGGVKVFTSTTGADESESTMKPSITITGKLSTLTHDLRAVPGQLKSFVQHIPAKVPIGEIQSITLTGTGEGLKWNCAGIKLRSGGVDEPVVAYTTGQPQESFWLESGQSVTLMPKETSQEDALAEDGGLRNEACKGFVATEQCQGDGPVDEDNAKHCTEDIDSTLSGYCDCSNEHRATVDCGHDTFTCEEICSM